MSDMGKRLGFDNCLAVGRNDMGVIWQCCGVGDTVRVADARQ